MKIEELRKIHQSACVSPGELDVVENHIDALLDVAEAAQEVIRTCGGLPGTEVLHEMEKALENLETIK